MNRNECIIKSKHLTAAFSAFLFFFVGGGCIQADKQPGISDIRVTESQLQISCTLPDTECQLVELESYQNYDSTNTYPVVWQGSKTSTITLDRYHQEQDRVYKKFLLIDAAGKDPIGNARYATTFDLDNKTHPLLLRPTEKKGLSCIVDINDAIKLGIKYVHENVYLHEIIDLNGSADTYRYEGVDIPINMSAIRTIDRRLKKFSDAEISVFAVFLNRKEDHHTNENPLIHPDTDLQASQTSIVAFNVENEKSCRYYRAALEFLAERYTRPDKKYGQISSLIVGNEVQQHWIWYNIGQKDEDAVLDNYHRAVRLAWLAAQKHHPDLKIYISMEHHWTQRSNPLREIQGNVFLEKMAGLSNRYGDFPWNLGFHPYPENIFDPRFWQDRTATDDFLTRKITFKNIEVLPRFMKQPHLLYQGKIRDIAITEQGFHTPDDPDGEKVQAAAYAYAFYKVSHIPEISAYVMHRHVDHRGEGGLLLGLWTADPEGRTADWPLNKKYIWEVFKYAGTPDWEKHFEFAKPIIGIKNWGDRPAEQDIVLKSAFNVAEEDVIYNFVEKFYEAKQSNNLDCKTHDILRAAGWMAPAIYQHPPADGLGELIYTLNVPTAKEGKRIKLVFETYLTAKSEDGVKASITVNGDEIFSIVQMSTPMPRAYNLDLTKYAGQTITLNFIVEDNGYIKNDWYNWVNPLLIYE